MGPVAPVISRRGRRGGKRGAERSFTARTVVRANRRRASGAGSAGGWGVVLGRLTKPQERIRQASLRQSARKGKGTNHRCAHCCLQEDGAGATSRGTERRGGGRGATTHHSRCANAANSNNSDQKKIMRVAAFLLLASCWVVSRAAHDDGGLLAFYNACGKTMVSVFGLGTGTQV